MLAPLWYAIGREAPGGIETFLYHLLKVLCRQGCEVTLLASGDSLTAARLVPVVERNLYDLMREGAAGEYVYYEQRQLQLAIDMAAQFDLVHSHVGPGGFMLSAIPGIRPRVLHTIHTPVTPDLQWLVTNYPHLALTTVSEFQAQRVRQTGTVHLCRVVPNGIDPHSFAFNDRPGDGLLFIGRIEPGKGPDIAIEVARTLERPLTLAGPVVDHAYFKSQIEPSFGPTVRYLGVVDHITKNRLMGEAACMLLPFRHAESFGMVSIEAMACGTPVVALANGALPEVVEQGVTGYLAENGEGSDTVRSLASLTLQAILLDRAAIREHTLSRFSIERTAEAYLQIYHELIAGHERSVEEAQPC
jgi:glycosyltransferase involved in cell wall biosynthesis